MTCCKHLTRNETTLDSYLIGEVKTQTSPKLLNLLTSKEGTIGNETNKLFSTKVSAVTDVGLNADWQHSFKSVW